MNIGGGNDVLFCGELTGLSVVVLAVIWVSVSINMSSLLRESGANLFLEINVVFVNLVFGEVPDGE